MGEKALPHGQEIGTFEGWSSCFHVQASPCWGQPGWLQFIQQELWDCLSPFLFLIL